MSGQVIEQLIEFLEEFTGNSKMLLPAEILFIVEND